MLPTEIYTLSLHDALPICRWHDTVVSSDHQNGNICPLCSACPHGSKSFVTGGIHKGQWSAVMFNTISTDMLGNPTDRKSSRLNSSHSSISYAVFCLKKKNK